MGNSWALRPQSVPGSIYEMALFSPEAYCPLTPSVSITAVLFHAPADDEASPPPSPPEGTFHGPKMGEEQTPESPGSHTALDAVRL